jgi:ArsR family transcriptional regulator, arsenate/arsenite/antimonite-responsive transcriptional repressor / arsenate reductase (thioredoxin)
MTKTALVAALESLAQETRFDIVRMLAHRGSDGMAPGEIRKRLGLPFPTVAFHLTNLKHSGVVSSRRESRTVLYDVRRRVLEETVRHLVEHCQLRSTTPPLKTVPRKEPSRRPMRILFLCTRNSARSIMAECAMNRWGEGRFLAFSAGSNPADRVHPATLRLLSDLQYETRALVSKSWDLFSKDGAPPLHFVFTLCDRAAAESCPTWPGQPLRAHWGIRDPLAVKASGPDLSKVVRETYAAIEQRIKVFTSLPVEALERFALERWIAEIGNLPLAA